MQKTTSRTILQASKLVYRAMALLEMEIYRMKKRGLSPDLMDDMLWCRNHLDQAVTEGLEHHYSDAEFALK